MISFSIKETSENEIGFRLGNIRRLVQMGLVDPELGTIPKQAQLATELCMRLTPPFAGQNAAGDNLTAKKMGENAVARDINAIVKGRDVEYLSFLVDLTGTTTQVQRTLRTKQGVPYVIDVDYIDQTGAGIRDFHHSKRDSRGRVLIATSKSNDNQIGRWKARNRLWAPAPEVKRYIRRKQDHVGWAKAGWLRAYRGLGGTRVSDWVARHGYMMGSLVNATGPENPNPYIQVNNNTAWGAKNNQADRVVSRALSARARAMKTYFEKMMELASKGTPTPFQLKQAALAEAA